MEWLESLEFEELCQTEVKKFTNAKKGSPHLADPRAVAAFNYYHRARNIKRDAICNEIIEKFDASAILKAGIHAFIVGGDQDRLSAVAWLVSLKAKTDPEGAYEALLCSFEADTWHNDYFTGIIAALPISPEKQVKLFELLFNSQHQDVRESAMVSYGQLYEKNADKLKIQISIT